MSTSTSVNTNQSSPTTSMPNTWESRIRDAATFMGLTMEIVERGLKELGVEREPAGMEMLSDESITPFGDLRAIFCDNALYGKVPIAKVRLAMKYLRGPKDSQKTDSIDPELVALKTKYGIRMKIEDVEPSELLEHYHPEQPNHPITTALKKKFGDKKIIVFKPDSKVVDIDVTANYIADLEQGFPEQDTIESDGVLVRIYSVGQVPNQMIEEDPLFEGKPLKRGRSIVNRVNWEGINLSTRQFCRIITDRDDIDVNDRFQVQELMKLASKHQVSVKGDVETEVVSDELRKTYPEADLEYRELVQKNELPKLVLTMESANGRKQDPFGVNRKF
jgi:hypothetical protein